MSLLVVLNIFLPLLFGTPAYYVAPTGADANPGTLAQPFKTINKAAAVVPPGGTVYVRGGVYRETVDITRSGTASAPTRYLAYAGESPVIDGGNVLPGSYRGLVNIKGDWNLVSGFEVTQSVYIGISAYGQHNQILNNYVHHVKLSGIGLYGDYNTAENNRVWRASLKNEYGVGNWSSGITASRGALDGVTQGAIIRGNTVWETWGQGISNHSDSALIEGNTAHDNFANNYYLNQSTNTVLRRNLSYFTQTSYVNGYGARVGILMGDEGCEPCSGYNTVVNNISVGGQANFDWYAGVSKRIHDTVFANNTFANARGQANVLFNAGDQADNVVFENNLIVQDDSVPILLDNGTGITFRHNLWNRSPDSAFLGANSLVADPLLLRGGSPFDPDWYRLQAGSPGRGKALLLPIVPDDYFGTPRLGVSDMGAVQN